MSFETLARHFLDNCRIQRRERRKRNRVDVVVGLQTRDDRTGDDVTKTRLTGIDDYPGDEETPHAHN